MIFYLSLKSMRARWFTTLLCLISIAFSTALYLGIERLRQGAKEGFTQTISQTDLILGAKGGSLQLLLYSVFHLGTSVNNIRYTSYQKWSKNPQVAWAIPISLGDSYKGHRVVATTKAYFDHYQFRGNQHLAFKDGQPFAAVFDVVVGADVKGQVGDPIVLAHGLSADSLYQHAQTPFKIVGKLAKTNTPIDAAVYISLEGMEAMHVGWEQGVPSGEIIAAERYLPEHLPITQVTAVLMKLKSRIAVLKMRRAIDSDLDEPLMAIIPGLSLMELWQMMGNLEQVLLLIGGSVLVVSAISILISLYTSLEQRRKEVAILRSLGARPISILLLFLSEALSLVGLGLLLGLLILWGLLLSLSTYLETQFSLYIPFVPLKSNELWVLLGILALGLFAGLLPALKAYRYSINDSL